MTAGKFRLHRRAFVSGAAASALVACAGRPRVGKDADVIVVGAGLSGLNAAMTLRESGYRVLVLESASRPGGRIKTLRDLPGQPEAGGTGIGQSYIRLKARAEELGVPLLYEDHRRDPSMLFIDSAAIAPKDWASSPLNPFPDAYKSATPGAALFVAAAAENPFTDNNQWRSAPAASDISAEAFLTAKGFNEESRKLINVSLNANNLSSYSMINLWRTLFLLSDKRYAGPPGVIGGGSDAITSAMAASLGGNLMLESLVSAVTSTQGGVSVSSGNDLYTADFCVLALPFPAVSKIRLDPAPIGAQRTAIESLPYTQIMRLYLEAETPFWKEDGMPPTMWSNGPLERVFPITERQTGEVACLQPWLNGEHARKMAKLPNAELEAMAQNEMKRMRPASDGKVRLLHVERWTDTESYAGGAYMHWAPGQIAPWATIMGAPLGRIHFAGEHLSYRHTGIEGAMESGERTAAAIKQASA